MCMLVESLDTLHSQAGCNCPHGQHGSYLFCCLVNLQLYQNNFWLIFKQLQNVSYCSSLCQDLLYFPSIGKEIRNETRLTNHHAVIVHLSQHLKQGTDFHKIWSGQYAIRGHLNPILFNIITLNRKIANVP